MAAKCDAVAKTDDSLAGQDPLSENPRHLVGYKPIPLLGSGSHRRQVPLVLLHAHQLGGVHGVIHAEENNKVVGFAGQNAG